ncbi:MAG TPA: response regulator [Terriglobales bacterium]|nr:response regulator [Terriglobales bacterium]
MLRKLSEQIRCYRKRLAVLGGRVQTDGDHGLRVDDLRCKQAGLKLGGGYEERLTLSVDEKKMLKDDGRRIGQVTDGGLGGGAAWVKRPERSYLGNDTKRLENRLIAIVDDDECARSGLSVLLESLGYTTAAFASAEEYLASDTSEDTAGLILDVHLSGLSGPDLQAALIAQMRCPPIVFVTGRFEEQVQKRVTEAGAVGYLIKPCSERALLDCIGKFLRVAA